MKNVEYIYNTPINPGQMKTVCTVNQALDKLLTKYKFSEINSNGWLSGLKEKLDSLKFQFGGNYKLPDPQQIESILDRGTSAH